MVWPFFWRDLGLVSHSLGVSQPSGNLIFIAEVSGGYCSLPSSQQPRRPEDFDRFCAGTPPLDIETPAGFPRYGGRGPAPGPSSGCGTGEHAVMAANLGLEAIGMDTAATAMAVAKEQSSGARPRRRFLDSDALRLASLGEPLVIVCWLGTVSRFRRHGSPFVRRKTLLQPSANWTLLDAVSQRVSTSGHASSAGYAIQDPDQFRPWLARGID